MAFAQILADGEYSIQCKINNVFCGFGGSTQSGTSFQVLRSSYDVNGVLVADGSVFIFTGLGNNVYTIKNKKSGKLLDASGGGTGNGTNIIQWDANGGNNQKWKVSKSSDRISFSMTGLASGRRIGLSANSPTVGNKFILWNQNNGNSQNFSFIKAPSTVPIVTLPTPIITPPTPIVTPPVEPVVSPTLIATFYRDANYGGTAISLPVGDYLLSDLLAKGILNNDISSLKVTTGYSVKLFFDDNWLGTTMESTTDVTNLLANGFDKQVTSITIHKDFTGLKRIDLFENCNYTGRWISLPLGNYTTAQLAEAGMPDKSISSTRKKDNVSSAISVYGSDNFLNFYLVLIYAKYSCLINTDGVNIDNSISSLIVYSAISASIPKKFDPISDNFRLAEENTAAIYPNPNSGSVTVNNLTGKSTIEIYNSLGLKVFETNTAGLATAETINTGAFFSGMYFIKVSSDDNKEATYKMIKN